MDASRILGAASLALFSFVSLPASAQRESATTAQESPATVDLVVRGRILDETSEPLPPSPGRVVLASLWTYRIHVVRVIRGHERSIEIVATGTSDPALRKDVDLVFDLDSGADGIYHVMSVKRG